MNALLNRIGEALYGDRWQTQMSEALDVSDRTIRRWVAGDVKIPRGVWNDLFVRLDVRRDNVAHLMDRVREEIDK